MKISDYSPPWWMSGRVVMVLSVGFFVVVTSVVVAFTIYSPAGIADKIDFASKTAFGSAAILSLLIGYQTLRLNIHQKQLEAAFELLMRYEKEEEKQARLVIDRLFSKTGKLREYLLDAIPPQRLQGFAGSVSDSDKGAARTVLSFYEDVSLAIKSGYASEPILFRSISPSAIKYINGLRPFIDLIREDEGDDLYYEDAYLLMKRWMQVEGSSRRAF